MYYIHYDYDYVGETFALPFMWNAPLVRGFRVSAFHTEI
jgi:hypothetical protein